MIERLSISDAGSPSSGALFQTTFATNVFGVVAVTEAFLPLLRRSAMARIVNVSTMGSLSDQADPKSPYYRLVVPAYQSSKTALNSITPTPARSSTRTGRSPGSPHVPVPAAQRGGYRTTGRGNQDSGGRTCVGRGRAVFLPPVGIGSSSPRRDSRPRRVCRGGLGCSDGLR
jgi:NAD(P)-dependent dehydrogenase (short-subunit alcohol dehydrogenase family)